jgi:hypothetical protein
VYALTKSGTNGNLGLSGSNSFTGGVILNTGILNIRSSNALGTIAGDFVINGGTINNNSGSAIAMLNYPVILNAGFVFEGSNDLNFGNGTVTLDADVDIQCNNTGNLTIGGTINKRFNCFWRNLGKYFWYIIHCR